MQVGQTTKSAKFAKRGSSKKPHVSLRLFENEFLEKLSHVHPITPLVIWAPVCTFFIWRSLTVLELPIAQVLGVGAIAFLFWTLAEYVLHRVIFHYAPRSSFGKRLIFIMHENHHADPQDPSRLVMPPAAALIFAVLFYAFFQLVLGPIWSQPFFAFFIIGYLCYDYIHFAVHHFTPRTPVGRYLKQSHMLHHFVTHDARWGVSSPLWDYVFGTTGRSPADRAHRSGGQGESAPGQTGKAGDREGANTASSSHSPHSQRVTHSP